jgi:hypothetical protein
MALAKPPAKRTSPGITWFATPQIVYSMTKGVRRASSRIQTALRDWGPAHYRCTS